MFHQKVGTHYRTFCVCQCDCGNTCVKEVTHLKRSGDRASCGCMSSYYRRLHNRSDETGLKFGRLTILEIDWGISPTEAVCQCDCGNIIRATKADVVCGHTRSCGCLQSESASFANTKDFSGIVSSSGVRLVNKAYQNNSGVWMWNCICPLCGEYFVALPAKVLSNHTTSCGCKVQSSPERIITTILTDLSVRFIPQYRLPDCRDKHTLPFDFAVFDDNGVLMTLIEYDGQQHFSPIPFWGGEDGFALRKAHDLLKTQYCEQHGITLLRLNYMDNEQNMKDKITNIIYP